MLCRAVGVEECAGDIRHGLSLPAHDHAGGLRHRRHAVGFQILRFGRGDEFCFVLGGDDHGHALLGFGDRQLRAVQPLIFLPYRVKFDAQPFGQLAHGDGDAARAEVVAALDEPRHVSVTEQPLNLALLRSVALLDLAGHSLKALHIMALAAARGAADTVPARASAQQDHHIAAYGTLPDHVLRRGRGHHRAALQTLGNIALVVDLRHMAGGEADLVAVGGITRRGGLRQLSLGQLARKCFRQGLARIAAAGDAHGLVNVGPPGERVADAAADAGGSTAEGLDLCGMVMGLVFEHQQPVLRLTVDLGGNMDGAGIDLLALVQFRERTAFFQCLCADGGDVHQGLRTRFGLLRAVDLLPQHQVAGVGLPDRVMLDPDFIEVGREGGVAAVVGPVGVHHADLRDGGVPVLLVPEIVLQKLQVREIHRKAQSFQQRGEPGFVHRDETAHRLYMVRLLGVDAQRLRFVEGGFPRLHRVDHVALNGFNIRLRERPVQRVDLRRANERAFAPAEHLNALGGGVGALVKLSRQRLHRKHCVGVRNLRRVGDIVQLRLGKHGGFRVMEQPLVDILGIVTVEDAHPLQPGNAEECAAVGEQGFRFRAETGLFL